jgi:hypothetical protein
VKLSYSSSVGGFSEGKWRGRAQFLTTEGRASRSKNGEIKPRCTNVLNELTSIFGGIIPVV